MKKWQKVLILLLTILFMLILYFIIKKDLLIIDQIAINFINKVRSDKLTSLMIYVTYLADVLVLILFCLIAFILFKNKKVGFSIITNLSLAALLNQVIKRIIKRTRPLDMIISETGYSFPSGHSMASFCFYGYLMYIAHKYINNRIIKVFVYILLSLIIIIVGFSRVYLGVHYLSDVLGGYTISCIYLIIYTKVSNKYLLKCDNK